MGLMEGDIKRSKHRDPLNHNPSGQYYNANEGAGAQTDPNNGWNIFNQIVGYGQTAFATAGQIGAQIQGTKPIDQGEIGNGAGTWEATSGINTRDEKKIIGLPQPLFWGGVVVVGVTVLFIAVKKFGPK